MVTDVRNEFVPDYAFSPGVTLLETLEELNMSQAELAKRTGRPKKTINEIVQGKTAITPETALQLERVLDIPANFWLKLEQNYQETLARLQDEKALKEQLSWLKQVPLKEMAERGWLESLTDPIAQLRVVLHYFGVVSTAQWELCYGNMVVNYRKSEAFEADKVALTAWLRKGELEAQKLQCQPYDKEKFQQSLTQIKPLTLEQPQIFQPELVRLCAGSGVAVVFVPELPKTRAYGATRWLTPNKALIQLSLRYKTDDHFWFTFFHEAGHLLLHGKRDFFLEYDHFTSEREQEANQFAETILIPSDALQQFVNAYFPKFSKEAIKQFATEMGVASGIVVGRLQHEDKLPRTHCNDLKLSFAWAD